MIDPTFTIITWERSYASFNLHIVNCTIMTYTIFVTFFSHSIHQPLALIAPLSYTLYYIYTEKKLNAVYSLQHACADAEKFPYCGEKIQCIS